MKKFVKSTPLALAVASTLAIVFSLSCKQDEVLKTIGDNPPPPDGAIPATAVDNFVSRSYISLLGRKPDSSETAAAVARLNAKQFAASARKEFLLDLTTDSAYVRRIYDAANLELLRGLDTFEVIRANESYLEYIANPYEDWMKFHLGLFRYELERNRRLLAADDQLFAAQITVRDLHRRMVDNEFYDAINMGTANFVLSLFESFLFRNPTDAEYEQATRMVDGKSAALFLRAGNCKEDFLDIFFDSDDYIAGQIHQIFISRLLRKPNAVEIQKYSRLMRETGFDLSVVEAEIMASDEFSGLKK
ncbi:MAG: hypothetical protein RMM53_03860 [Bacteroidia bacterium]|nr:hypothetical protein [Bacteroidia bacterium]